MLRKEKGFTLIELLIVIAIIGILAAIAIPMYRAYTVKAKMSEVTNAMSQVASAVANHYQETESLVSAGNKASIHGSLGVGLENVTRVHAMSVSSGIITATITGCGNPVDGSTLTLTPAVNQTDRSISWTWGGTVPSAYIPKK